MGIYNNHPAKSKKKEKIEDKFTTVLERQDKLLNIVSFRYSKPLKDKFKEIIESVAKTMQVERVSIWNYDKNQDSLVTEGIYSLNKNKYLPGLAIQKKKHPIYFKELAFNHIIEAYDALNDPRISELGENYLKPNKISSVIITPIKLRGDFVGIICLEQIGHQIRWSHVDKVFISFISDIISLAIENDEFEKSHKKVSKQVEKIKNAYQILEMTNSVIKEKEQLLSSIYDTVQDVIFVVAVEKDDRYRFTSVNKQFLTKTGLKSTQVIGKYVDEVIPPSSLNLVLEKYKKSCREKKIVSWEETSDYPTGTITGEVNIAPLIDKWGNCTNLIGAVHDITERQKSEKKIQESLVRFRRFAAISHEAIVIHDNGKLIEINPSFSKMFGYEEFEPIGMDFSQFASPESVEFIRGKMIEGAKDPFEGIGLRKDGSTFYAELQGRRIEYEGRNLIVTTILDITERKRSAEKIREIFERITDAFIALDKNWRYTYVNKKAGEIFNRNPEQMIGKHMWTEFPEGIDQPFYKAYYKAMAEQRYIYLEEYYPPYDTWFESHIYPSPDGLSIFFRDINERKKSEENLRMAYQRLTSHLNNTPLAVIEWNKNLIIQKWSIQAEKIFGWKEAEVIHKHFSEFDLVFKDDSQNVNVISNELMSGSVDNNTIISRNNTKSGKVIYCQWYNSVLKDKDGNVLTIMSLIEEITERIEAENVIKDLNDSLEYRVNKRTEELMESNKALESFSSMVSHDLRAPLRTVIGFTEIIQKKYSSSFEPDLKELFEYIINNSKRMNLIIEDLLKLARYGKEKLLITSIDMTRLFKDIWENLKKTTTHHVEFELPELPGIEGDISMIEQVVLNLLSNAIKFSSKTEKPKIKIGYTSTVETITFFVKDNGVGFDMAYYGKLFGAFQRLHDLKDFEGTGIGLLLVKKIIENHGGKVWAEGKVNAGATFYFSFPKKLIAK